MNPTTTTATAAEITKRVQRKMKHATKFATDEHAGTTPLALRHPYTRGAWKRMPEAERLAHITRAVEAEVRTALASAKTPAPARDSAPAEKTPASAPAPAEAPAKPSTAGRYLVACVAGCGSFLPATSAKPVVVRCSDQHRAASANTKAEPRVGSRGEISTFDLIQRYRAEVVERAEDGVENRGESPAKKAAKKRRKRRAVCPNSPKPSADLV